MGLVYSQLKCDNCGSLFYVTRDTTKFEGGQLSRFALGKKLLPDYTRKPDEVLCVECYRFHEESWAKNQRRNKPKLRTSNFVSDMI
jgi:hypothetical protein